MVFCYQLFVLDDFFGRVEAFLNSDQNRAGTRLLSAYTDGDVEEIKKAAQSSIISNLDHVVNLLIHLISYLFVSPSVFLDDTVLGIY